MAKPVLVHAPIFEEMDVLLEKMGGHRVIDIKGYRYYKGKIEGCPVIIARTYIGQVNCAVSTLLAIQRFRLLAVIDQGTSGGHDKTLKVGDIVLCESTVYGDAVKTGDPPKILPIEAVTGDGVTQVTEFKADSRLLALAKGVGGSFEGGRVVVGRAYTTHRWNTLPEDILAMGALRGSSVEEMEAAAGAQVCNTYGLPYIAIRILSNSDVSAGAYDVTVGRRCQRFVIEVIKRIYGKDKRIEDEKG